MNGGYQWLGEFVFGGGGTMDDFTRARITEIFNKAQNGLSLKPLRVSIKMDKTLPPIESYASIIKITGTPDNNEVMLKVDSHYINDINNLYLRLNQNGTYVFESN